MSDQNLDINEQFDAESFPIESALSYLRSCNHKILRDLCEHCDGFGCPTCLQRGHTSPTYNDSLSEFAWKQIRRSLFGLTTNSAPPHLKPLYASQGISGNRRRSKADPGTEGPTGDRRKSGTFTVETMIAVLSRTIGSLEQQIARLRSCEEPFGATFGELSGMSGAVHEAIDDWDKGLDQLTNLLETLRQARRSLGYGREEERAALVERILAKDTRPTTEELRAYYALGGTALDAVHELRASGSTAYRVMYQHHEEVTRVLEGDPEKPLAQQA